MPTPTPADLYTPRRPGISNTSEFRRGLPLSERTFTNIQRWSEMPRGGHFAAMEQPEALAAEVHAFFRPLRQPGRV